MSTPTYQSLEQDLKPLQPIVHLRTSEVAIHLIFA